MAELGAETAAGEVARLLASALDAAAIPHASVQVGADGRSEPPADGGTAFDINLLCLDADRLQRFARDTGPAFFAGRYTVGYCFFEIAAPPTGWASAFAAVDEIWAPTDVAAAALREVSRKPVFTVPLPIRVPAGVVRGPRTGRGALPLPDDRGFPSGIRAPESPRRDRGVHARVHSRREAGAGDQDRQRPPAAE